MIRKVKNTIKKLIIHRPKRNFRHFADLSVILKKFCTKLPSDIDLIVGIPRSGIVPAYMMAQFLNKSCCSLDEFINRDKIEHFHSGHSFRNSINQAKNVLIVDDSIYSGSSITEVKRCINKCDTRGCSIKYAAIFAKKGSTNKVDYYAEICDTPRIFQWNYMRCPNACYDIDGVLCLDPTKEQNDDGEKYLDFIKNAKPLFIPKNAFALVTSRLEKYRKPTEEWLEKNKIKYDNLYMLNLSSKKERIKLGCYAEFKANIYKNLKNTVLFIESEPAQAKDIAHLSGKPCVCSWTDEFFDGSS